MVSLSQLALVLTAAGQLRFTAAQSCGSDCPLYSLAFHDEFTGNALNTTAWNYRTDQKAESAQLSTNIGVSGGYMYIYLKEQTVGAYTHTGGGIVSKPNFQYGFYEARQRLNAGSGWHSSFWMMAGDGTTTSNTASPNWTEIDTYEVDSIAPSNIRHNILTWRDESNGSPTASEITSNVHKAAVDYADGYHIFGTLWNETTVTFYTDGVLVDSYSYLADSNPHDYLNIWVSCIGYVDTIDNSYLPNNTTTDYVRFWQRDYYLTATSLCRSVTQGSTPCPSNEGYSETGTWGQSTIDGYTLALKSRYSCHLAGNTASWSQVVAYAGTYQVSAWIVANSDSDQSAAYTVKHNGASVGSTSVDQTSGSSRWVTLANSVTVSAGDTIEAILKASGSGCARSDTVKLVRTS